MSYKISTIVSLAIGLFSFTLVVATGIYVCCNWAPNKPIINLLVGIGLVILAVCGVTGLYNDIKLVDTIDKDCNDNASQSDEGNG